MSHSLGAKLSGLRHKGYITDIEYQKLKKALEQEPTVTSTNNSGDMVCPQVDSVTPTVISNDDSYYKFVKNYNNTLPPNVHIMEIELGKGESMTREEAKTVFLNRGYIEVGGGTIYDADKWRESCRVISEWLEQEPSRDMKEIKEVINCDADAETKCKMISNILTAKPHYFEKQESINKTVQKAYEDGKKDGYVQAKIEQEPTVTSTNNSGEMIYPQVDGITPTVVEPIGDDYKYIKSISNPTGIEFDIDIDKKVESYGKLLKHPVVKHIMDMDETQEQIDFVQPHKKIPVTLTVQKEKTCDGCLFQQYPRITVCQECSRYYSDNYVKE